MGLWEKTPQKLAGTRSEPPISEPISRGVMPTASAAAAPPDEPTRALLFEAERTLGRRERRARHPRLAPTSHHGHLTACVAGVLRVGEHLGDAAGGLRDRLELRGAAWVDTARLHRVDADLALTCLGEQRRAIDAIVVRARVADEEDEVRGVARPVHLPHREHDPCVDVLGVVAAPDRADAHERGVDRLHVARERHDARMFAVGAVTVDDDAEADVGPRCARHHALRRLPQVVLHLLDLVGHRTGRVDHEDDVDLGRARFGRRRDARHAHLGRGHVREGHARGEGGEGGEGHGADMGLHGHPPLPSDASPGRSIYGAVISSITCRRRGSAA